MARGDKQSMNLHIAWPLAVSVRSPLKLAIEGQQPGVYLSHLLNRL